MPPPPPPPATAPSAHPHVPPPPPNKKKRVIACAAAPNTAASSFTSASSTATTASAAAASLFQTPLLPTQQQSHTAKRQTSVAQDSSADSSAAAATFGLLPSAPPAAAATAAPSITLLPPPATPATPASSRSSYLYNAATDSANFFSEQDLLGIDHAYIFTRRGPGGAMGGPRAAVAMSPGASPSASPASAAAAASASASSAAAVAAASPSPSPSSSSSLPPPPLFEGYGMARSDFTGRVEGALFNARERMRDEFLELLRKFVEQRSRNNRLGAGGAGGNISSSSAASSSSLQSPTELIRPHILLFLQNSHPANFGWFALELFVTLLLQKCWSGVEDVMVAQVEAAAARGRRGSQGAAAASATAAATGASSVAGAPSPRLSSSSTATSSSSSPSLSSVATSASSSLSHSSTAFAHQMLLHHRMVKPSSSSSSTSSSTSSTSHDRRPSSGAPSSSTSGWSSARSSVTPSPRLGPVPARAWGGTTGATTMMATPIKSAWNTAANSGQQQQQQQQTIRALGPPTQVGGAKGTAVAATASPLSQFPPYLSFTFSSSSPSPLSSLFPELQEFFSFFLLVACDSSHKLMVHIQQALLLKLHQLCDVSGGQAGMGGVQHHHHQRHLSLSHPSTTLSSGSSVNSLTFTSSSALDLARTWHGRILKLKLLSKFLSFVLVLPHADLSRLAKLGGGAMGTQAAPVAAAAARMGGGIGTVPINEEDYAPSAVLRGVVEASTQAMNVLTFPPFNYTQPTLATGSYLQPATSSSSTFSFQLVPPAFGLPLHLYLSYARRTHSLSLFLPWLCSYLRVLKFDLVQLHTDYTSMVLADLAHIYFGIKRAIRHANLRKQLEKRMQAQGMGGGGNAGAGSTQLIARAYSSPSFSSMSTPASSILASPVTLTPAVKVQQSIPSTIAAMSTAAVAPSVAAAASSKEDVAGLSPLFTPLSSPTHSPAASPPPSGSASSAAVPLPPSKHRVVTRINTHKDGEVDVDASTPPLSPQGGAIANHTFATPSSSPLNPIARHLLHPPSPASTSSHAPHPSTLASPAPSTSSVHGSVFGSPFGSPASVASSSYAASPGVMASSSSAPSPYTGHSLAHSSTSNSSSSSYPKSQFFLLFELEELFEWLELDVAAYNDAFEERRRRQGGGDPAHSSSAFSLFDPSVAANIIYASPGASPASTMATSAAAAAAVASMHPFSALPPASLSSSQAAASTTSTSSSAVAFTASKSKEGSSTRPATSAKKSLMSQFSLSAQPTLLKTSKHATLPSRLSAMGAATFQSMMNGAASASSAAAGSTAVAATAQPALPSTQAASGTAPAASSSSSLVPPAVPAPTPTVPPFPRPAGSLTLDSIPSLVPDHLFLSLLASSHPGKSMEQIRSMMRREGGGEEQEEEQQQGGGATANGQAGSKAPTLRRTVSAANRRKITLFADESGASASADPNAAASGTSSTTPPAASSSASSSASPASVPPPTTPAPPSTSSLLSLLRPAFFARHPELSPLIRQISVQLESHVAGREGIAVLTPITREVERAVEEHVWQKQREVEQMEAATTPGQRIAALLPLLDSLPKLESTLQASLIPSLQRLVMSEVLDYLTSSMLKALEALVSPSLCRQVLHTASLLAAKNSMEELKPTLTTRVKKVTKEKLAAAIKKAKTNLQAKIKGWRDEKERMQMERAAARAAARATARPTPSGEADLADGMAQLSVAESSGPSTPASSSSSSPAPSNVVSIEVAARVKQARACIGQVQEELDAAPSSPLPRPTLLLMCKRLLRCLMPLTICVASTQVTPLLARQTSFAPFEEDSTSKSESKEKSSPSPSPLPCFFMLLLSVLARVHHQLTLLPSSSPPVPVELAHCWLQLEPVYRTVRVERGHRAVDLEEVQRMSGLQQLPADFLQRINQVTEDGKKKEVEGAAISP